MDVHLRRIERRDDEGVLRLTWTDGHEADLSYRYLRGFCPCAGCQGHAAIIEYREPPGPVRVERIERVGNYAVSLAFSDAHATGIYGFDYLRRICPCAACGGPPSTPRPS